VQCLSKADRDERGPGSVDRQAAALRREGVQVQRGSLGERFIDLATYGWFPDVLPSDEADASDDDDNDDNDTGLDAEGDHT
jgi:methylated-DNA-protein-cysteine methyltransferase related protein